MEVWLLVQIMKAQPKPGCRMNCVGMNSFIDSSGRQRWGRRVMMLAGIPGRAGQGAGRGAAA